MSDTGGFIWYELLTKDADAACAFYEPVLGWTMQAAQPGGIDYRMITTPAGNVGGAMQLTPEMTAAGAQPTWLGYVHVADTDATVDAIKAAGGHVHMGPHSMPGVGRFALTADPQGAAIYVMTPEGEGMSNAFAPELNGHAAWNELATSDPKAALAFYTEHLGWTASTLMPMGAGDYQLIAQGGRDIGGITALFPGVPAPRWLYYFRVDDVDEALDRVVSHGGTVLNGPHQVPGGGWILIAQDPEGVGFALTGPRDRYRE